MAINRGTQRSDQNLSRPLNVQILNVNTALSNINHRYTKNLSLTLTVTRNGLQSSTRSVAVPEDGRLG